MKKSISIMLDTSIYKQTPKLNSELFKRFIKYSQIGFFKLYISEIIENEYITWIKKESQDAHENVVKSTEALNKFYEKPDFFGLNLRYNITAEIAQTQINEILKKVLENWNTYKKETKAIVIPIHDTDGKQVMNAYFNGSKPFKAVKNRLDIPDAFIYFAIIRILKTVDKMVFITRDKDFSNRINNERIKVFENLTELFSKEEYSLQNDYFKELNTNDKAYFVLQYFKKEITRKLERQIEITALFPDSEQELIDHIIGEYKDLTIKTKNSVLNLKTVRIISALSFLIEFTSEVEYLISSKATKADLEYAGSERIKKLKGKEINDEDLFDIIEETVISIGGNISISFKDSDPLMWSEKVVSNNIFPITELEEINIVIEDFKRLT